jgi:sulfite reductase (NADPH) hemoprotein beta-component
MIRLRIPGGFITPDQWLAAHHIAGNYSTGVIKITTRQTIQLHGI